MQRHSPRTRLQYLFWFASIIDENGAALDAVERVCAGFSVRLYREVRAEIAAEIAAAEMQWCRIIDPVYDHNRDLDPCVLDTVRSVWC